jgi:hypothetical protein
MTDYIQASILSLEEKKVMEALRTEMIAVAQSSTNAANVQSNLDAEVATIITDLGNLRTAVNYGLGALDTLATKLNADTGVTDTDYATDNATHDAPAITTT